MSSFISPLQNLQKPKVNQRVLLTWSVLIVLLAPITDAFAAKAADTARAQDSYSGFTLNGTAKFGMKSVVSICRSGFRYFDGQRALLCASPKWQTYMVNFKKKIYMPLDKINSKNQLQFLNANLRDSDANWQKYTEPSHRTYLGHRVHVWHLYTGPRSSKTSKPADYWELLAMDELPIPPTLSRANSEMHGIPKIPYHPVSLIHNLPDGRREIYLQALSIKPARFHASDFALPKEFKVAISEAELGLEMDGVAEFIDAISDPRLREK